MTAPDEEAVQKVRLTLYAKDLKNVASFRKGSSSPYAVVSQIFKDEEQEPTVLGRTEVVPHTQSPKWTTTFDIDYPGGDFFFNVAIFHTNEKEEKQHKSMGTAVFNIKNILEMPGENKAKGLQEGGTLYAAIEMETKGAKGRLFVTLSGINLKNVEFLSFFGDKSDPFFEFSNQKGEYSNVVYRSKFIKNTLNPGWDEAEIDLEYLCNCNFEENFTVNILDFERSGYHQLIGSFSTTVKGLVKAYERERPFIITNGEKKTGAINVVDIRLEKNDIETTVDEYHILEELMRHKQSRDFENTNSLRKTKTKKEKKHVHNDIYSKENPPKYSEYVDPSICQLSVVVAIDFSGSNGDPTKPGTLHEIRKDGKLNDYEEAIVALGSLLHKLDEDENYPVWGFGVKYGGEMQNCFQVGPDEEVAGVNGILKAYRGMFRKPLTMSGPTDLTGVIDHAAKFAQGAFETAMKNNMISYTTLIILTDGSVCDVSKLMNSLSEGSKAPLSVVIVGVGRNEFSAMKFVDEFTVQGTPDICSFVEFEAYKRNTNGLVRAILEEIPDQLKDFFIEREIYPNSNFEEMESPFIEDADVIGGDVSEVGQAVTKPKQLDVHRYAFKVQVAPGITPGTCMIVESPFTGKELHLRVPFGVPPGGTFVVNG